MSAKHAACLLLTVAVLLLATMGCSEHEADIQEAVTIDGLEAIIKVEDDGSGSVVADGQSYTFLREDDNALVITYPNGYVYTQLTSSTGITLTWPYGETAGQLGYLDGVKLAGAIEEIAGEKDSGILGIASLMLSAAAVALGCFMILAPRTFLRLFKGRLNIEPNNLAIIANLAVGYVLAILGLIYFLAE